MSHYMAMLAHRGRGTTGGETTCLWAQGTQDPSRGGGGGALRRGGVGGKGVRRSTLSG